MYFSRKLHPFNTEVKSWFRFSYNSRSRKRTFRSAWNINETLSWIRWFILLAISKNHQLSEIKWPANCFLHSQKQRKTYKRSPKSIYVTKILLNVIIVLKYFICFFKKSGNYCDQIEDLLNTRPVSCHTTGAPVSMCTPLAAPFHHNSNYDYHFLQHTKKTAFFEHSFTSLSE
jgi:hypothetical protein